MSRCSRHTPAGVGLIHWHLLRRADGCCALQTQCKALLQFAQLPQALVPCGARCSLRLALLCLALRRLFGLLPRQRLPPPAMHNPKVTPPRQSTDLRSLGDFSACSSQTWQLLLVCKSNGRSLQLHGRSLQLHTSQWEDSWLLEG